MKDNENKHVLYCRLKKLMSAYDEGKGISASKLATEIDERRSTLNDLIANKDMDTRRIPARLIVKLCDFFKVPVSELFKVAIFENPIDEPKFLYENNNDNNNRRDDLYSRNNRY